MGFTLTERFPGAGFLGAGGYHHHIGVNTWHSKGAAPPPAGSLGLLTYTIVLASEEERETILKRLDTEISKVGSRRQNRTCDFCTVVIPRNKESPALQTRFLVPRNDNCTEIKLGFAEPLEIA